MNHKIERQSAAYVGQKGISGTIVPDCEKLETWEN